MKQIAIDTNIVDHILNGGVLDAIQRAAEAGRLIIITNHVLRDEINQTRSSDLRETLLEVYDALPKQDVATHGTVHGISKWGASQWGDPSDLETSGRGSLRDALIGMTAAGQADVLVTEDGELRRKVKERMPKLEVWRFQEFVAFVRQEPPTAQE